MEELEELKSELAEPLDTENGNNLSKQLANAEAWSARVSSLYRAAEKTLAEAKPKSLIPKSKDITELDRNIFLESELATEVSQVNLLKDFAEIIKRRISLGQTLLKNMTQEIESGIR